MNADDSAVREFPRISAENAVFIHRLGPEAEERLAKTRQIGLGGVMVTSSESIPVDTFLRLMINVQHEVIETAGRVVWEQANEDGSFDVGVAFVFIETSHLERLLTYLQESEKNNGEEDELS